jgi:selenide,water dikinase
LPLETLGRILQGGAETARLAGATIVGGHTIDDPEPKYGMAVTGVIRPGSEMTNAAVQPGDLLVLTKPLGTGIVATAIKKGLASATAIAAATLSMASLNREGAEVARAHDLRALTDVTGFGLLGHLSEMGRASGVSLELWYDRLPFLPEVTDLAQAGVVPGGTRRNLEFAGEWTAFLGELEEWQRLLVADAQTSGGLILAVPADRISSVVADLVSRNTLAAAVVGRATPAGDLLITVRRGVEQG